MIPPLHIDQVTVRVSTAQRSVLEGLSFTLQEGERAALLGLNGSGKTTLLRAVVGLVPHTGTLSVCGTQVTDRALQTVRAQVGFLCNVPEDQLLFPRVLDDVAFGLRRRGVPPDQAAARALQALEQLGVAALAHRQVYDLSHGQKLRVALAGVLVLNPPLLLLDEPTAGLDPPGCAQLARLLSEQRTTLLVATHDLAFAEQLCGRQLLLEQGHITYDGADIAPVREAWRLPSAQTVG